MRPGRRSPGPRSCWAAGGCWNCSTIAAVGGSRWAATWLRSLEQIAAHHEAGQRVVVLVSGDPGLFSLGRNIVERFGRENCEVIAAVSSVQVAFARLGLDWGDARIVSAHGRRPAIDAQELAGCDKLAVLGGTPDALEWTAWAADVLDASHNAYLCENLTLPGERIRQLGPGELAAAEAGSLWIVILVRRSILVTTNGTLYGIGVGPGDPEWITVKAARILAGCRHVYAPRSRLSSDSVALEIARRYLRPDCIVHELTFPMTADKSVLAAKLAAGGRRGRPDVGGGRGLLLHHAGRPALVFDIYLSAARVAGDSARGPDRDRAGRDGAERRGGPG